MLTKHLREIKDNTIFLSLNSKLIPFRSKFIDKDDHIIHHISSRSASSDIILDNDDNKLLVFNIKGKLYYGVDIIHRDALSIIHLIEVKDTLLNTLINYYLNTKSQLTQNMIDDLLSEYLIFNPRTDIINKYIMDRLDLSEDDWFITNDIIDFINKNYLFSSIKIDNSYNTIFRNSLFNTISYIDRSITINNNNISLRDALLYLRTDYEVKNNPIYTHIFPQLLYNIFKENNFKPINFKSLISKFLTLKREILINDPDFKDDYSDLVDLEYNHFYKYIETYISDIFKLVDPNSDTGLNILKEIEDIDNKFIRLYSSLYHIYTNHQATSSCLNTQTNIQLPSKYYEVTKPNSSIYDLYYTLKDVTKIYNSLPNLMSEIFINRITILDTLKNINQRLVDINNKIKE